MIIPQNSAASHFLQHECPLLMTSQHEKHCPFLQSYHVKSVIIIVQLSLSASNRQDTRTHLILFTLEFILHQINKFKLALRIRQKYFKIFLSTVPHIMFKIGLPSFTIIYPLNINGIWIFIQFLQCFLNILTYFENTLRYVMRICTLYIVANIHHTLLIFFCHITCTAFHAILWNDFNRNLVQFFKIRWTIGWFLK